MKEEEKKELSSSHLNVKNDTRTIYINDSLRNMQFNYRENYIRTTKYTKWNFLPLSLLY